MRCPNINSPEWKSLVNKIGENNAWKEFLANNDIPSADNYDVIEPINIEQNALQETEQIKPGVEELFDSNPELANEVYQVLGIKSANINLKIEPFGKSIDNIDIIKDGKKIGYTQISKSSTSKILIVTGIELKEKGLGKNVYLELQKQYPDFTIKSDKTALTQDAINMWDSLVAKGVATKEGEKQYTLNTKQALQLYSQYLDSIFPDSQLKDIVYHAGYNTIEKFIKRDNGIFFSDNLEYTKNLIIQKIKNDSEYGGVTMSTEEAEKKLKIYNVLLNSNNIKNLPKVNSQIIKDLKKENFDTVKGIEDGSNQIESYVVFKPEQIHILGNEQDIEEFKKFVDGKKTTITPIAEKKEILYSIKTKSVEKIAEGLNTELVRSEQQIKYSGYIKTMVLTLVGDIGPGKKLKMSPEEAFQKSKEMFIKINNNIATALNTHIKSQEDFLKVKESTSYEEIIKIFPVLKYANTYEDLQKAAGTYNDVITKFDTYVSFVKIDLAHNGIRIVKNKIQNVDVKELADKNEDESDDSAEISQNEIGERYDINSFETNPRDTASVRVKALIQTIATGEYEFGVPLYANPNDVFADILEIGAEIDLSGYTSDKTKLTEFKRQLADRAQSRPYLSSLLNKIEQFEKNNEWERVNDILTVASKAYAIETLLLYQLQKNGSKVTGTTNVKVISTNRDTVDLQISKEWLFNHLQSDFYEKNSQKELFPKQSKIDLLNKIIEEGVNKESTIQNKKFQEFFNVLGIDFTEEEINVISNKLPKALNVVGLNVFFQKNKLLKNIVNSFETNIEEPFQGQYGFQNESTSMKELAKIYYELNPGRYKIASTKTADNKSKYAYILPSYLEQIKREWENGNTSSVVNGVLSKPNSKDEQSFWNKVINDQAKFKLDYFNGVREQKVGENGKVRKSLTPKEQIATMFLLHQESLDVSTYVAFTLSDKTTTMESVMTKEFFVNTSSSSVGVNVDYNILDNKITYTNDLKKKIYNSFVEPEISRILASIKNTETINVENYDIASKLFYFLPNLNRNASLVDFRNDLYSGSFTIEELSTKYSDVVGQAVLNEIQTDTELEIDRLIALGIIEVDKNNNYTYPLFVSGFKQSDYVNAFRNTNAKGKNMARLMVMDMKLNYLNSQIKTIQYLKFDPALAFKTSIDVKDKTIADITDDNKVSIVNTTWDEFSKRAAALIAPGTQGNWAWKIGNDPYKEGSEDYITVTAKDVKVEVKNTDGTLLNKSEITDAEEFVTMQEHIDYLMSEGKIPYETWLSIYNKIKKAGPGGYYELTKEELNLTISPTKPVYVNYTKIGDEELGLNRIDYVKSSRYPLIPQQEAGSERDKLRMWMEKNNVKSVNFASAKKLGRPTKSLELFNKDNNFKEPSDEDFKSSMQMLSRSGIRNQQEIPDQKDEISTVTQMNRTLFDGLLEVKDFNFGNMKNVTGAKGKEIKEAVRARLFEIESQKLKEEIGNLNLSHEKLYKLLKGVIENDTTGSYTQNDLLALEINPKTKKFKIPLEAQWKLLKFQSLINSLINKNVMLKVEGSSFVQVSGVGSKYTFSKISKGIKSDVIWIDKYADDFAKDGATLKYIRQENKKTKAAQVLVSQYLKDEEGNLIDLTDYITEDKYGRKILDTSKMDEKMFQLIGTRIPNQSHPSTLPIEVVGFLPSYMENSIVVPDGITGQMGSDFDVDKLYAYFSKFKYNKEDKSIKQITYDLNSIDDVNKLDKDQLNQLYRDIHWEVLTNSATFDKITKAVDMPEVKEKVKLRGEELKKYNLVDNVKVNLPLDYMTSISRYIDNRAGKTGVSIFATLISAQADFQDKVIRLKTDEETGAPNPIEIKLSKNSAIINLEFIGKLGESTSFLNEKRSISENLNMMFSESVDNAKNQFLKEFNWTEKAMSPIGVLAMLTDKNGNSAPIDFMMDLTSQSTIVKLFEMIEQKQDSFGQYDNDALVNSAKEIQNKIIKKIDTEGYLPTGQSAEFYFDPKNKIRNTVLDAETLSEAWLIGKAIDQKADDKVLKSMAEDLKYNSVNEMLLTYYNTQFNTLNIFKRLEGTGRELMTILGAVYPYTKGIGANVFSTKQKTNQLNKLSNSSIFEGLDKIAGEIDRLENGDIQITPIGEIGSAINNSLIFAQDNIYKNLFPISSGIELETVVNRIVDFMGLDKANLSKDKYQSIYTTVFNSMISYVYTNPSFELFEDVIEERNKLINGETSIGYRIIELNKDPKYAKNGFLKNIEVVKDYKTDTYSISFKDPFGTESDDKEVTLGFYNLALDENNEIKQLAKDLALYPFATADAGKLGRYIPVGYYNSDADFNKAMANFERSFVDHLIKPESQSILIDQIVQNNPDMFSKSFSFTTTIDQTPYDSSFKTVFKKIINADRLKDINTFTFKIGDFSNNDKYKGIIQSLKVPLTDSEQKEVSKIISLPLGINFKYPQYILLKDEIQSNLEGIRNENVSYLYKRTSSLVTENGDATYERIEILGYKNISEFDFNNPNLVSVIEMNNVSRDEIIEENKQDILNQPPSISTPITSAQEFTSTQPLATTEVKPGVEINSTENIKVNSTNEYLLNNLKNGLIVNLDKLHVGDDTDFRLQDKLKQEISEKYTENILDPYEKKVVKNNIEKIVSYIKKASFASLMTSIDSYLISTDNFFKRITNNLYDEIFDHNGFETRELENLKLIFVDPKTNKKYDFKYESKGYTSPIAYQKVNVDVILGKDGKPVNKYELLEKIANGELIIDYIINEDFYKERIPDEQKREFTSKNIEKENLQKIINKEIVDLKKAILNKNIYLKYFTGTNKIKHLLVVPSNTFKNTLTTKVKPGVETSSNIEINIYSGTGENSELSNFAIRPFTIKGMEANGLGDITYQSVEQAFQYAKTMYANSSSAVVSGKILKTTNGAELKSLGKKIDLDSNSWDKVSSKKMKSLLLESFKQNSDALQKLLATGNATLTHKYKGVEQDNGRFSKVLMEVRKELQNNNIKQKEITEQTEEPEIKTTTIDYKGTTFIVEGTQEEGDVKIFYQAQGGKGEEVKDVNLSDKVFVAHIADIHPDWVVTLTGIQNQPKYLVGSQGEVISLQDTSYGKVIQSQDIIERVMSLYYDKSQIEKPVIITEKLEPTPVVEEAPVKKEKRINVPKGSNPNNNVIMETSDTIFLMNDGQQEAFDFIKGKVEELLANKKRISADDLNNTIIFNDPLTNKFNGLIPVEMWNNMIGLAGRGGVGKTTLIKSIIAAIEGKNKYAQPSVMYLTPGHTAATVLQESLGLDSEVANDGKVNTIASQTRRNKMVDNVLSLSTEKEYIKSTQFKPSMGRPDIIIVDESSMIGTKDFSDILLRLKQDLNNGLINRMPIFIFMGDYRQLGPIGEQQSKDVNKGLISATLLLDKSKTKELTQVMRSDNELLHKVYDQVGNEIEENINNLKNNKPIKQLSFDKYDKLTNKSTENILVVKNEDGVIDDYTNYLIQNNNPYGMFWVHYNNVDHGNTKNLSKKIRNDYFTKLGLDSSSPSYRLYANQDYVIFNGKVEIATSEYEYVPSNDKIKKLLDKQKYTIKDGAYKINRGAVKPGARFKVLDIETKSENIANYVSSELLRFLPKNMIVEIEHTIVYNRQDRIRHIHKVLGIEVVGTKNAKTGEFEYGKYNTNTSSMEGIQIKNIKTGEIISTFNLKYGDYLNIFKPELDRLNEFYTPPYVPSYIGSSHTAQGNSIKNVIVGDYNIKKNAAANVNQDDIFSSMYVALTRTSGSLIIIKPAGADIINNQEVFLGAITDDNQAQRMTSASEIVDVSEEIEIEKTEEPIDFMDMFMQQAATNSQNEIIEEIFGKNKTAAAILNALNKNTTPFYKQILSLISKTGGVGNLKIVIDETITDPGSYNLNTETITVNPKLAFESNPGNANALFDVIIHELLHHVTAKIINADKSKLSLEQRKWVVSLENLFKQAQDKILNDPIHGENLKKAIIEVNKEGGFLSVKDKSMYYGLTNINEFISMLMSDDDFKNFMNNTPYSGNKTLLDRFIDIFVNILKSLGITVNEDSVLKEGIQNIIGVIQSRNMDDSITIDSNLKSIKTQSFVDGIVESEFDKIIKYLDIKTKCK